jgi:hypothetical protein
MIYVQLTISSKTYVSTKNTMKHTALNPFSKTTTGFEFIY